MLHVELCRHGGEDEANEKVQRQGLAKHHVSGQGGHEHGCDGSEVLCDVVQVLENKGGGKAHRGVVEDEGDAQQVVAPPELLDASTTLERVDKHGDGGKEGAPEVELQVLPVDGVVGVLQELLAVHPGKGGQRAVDSLEDVALGSSCEGQPAIAAVLQLADQAPQGQQKHPSPLDCGKLPLHHNLKDDGGRDNLEVVEDLEAEGPYLVDDDEVEVVCDEVEQRRHTGGQKNGPLEGEAVRAPLRLCQLLPKGHHRRHPHLQHLAVEGHGERVIVVVGGAVLGGLGYQRHAARQCHLPDECKHFKLVADPILGVRQAFLELGGSLDVLQVHEGLAQAAAAILIVPGGRPLLSIIGLSWVCYPGYTAVE
mmetsp:Transcript_19329/g.53883  ORF Transcript_19329/g.53883 Transcript_19329/m.53883 type:complete len:367 (+) Transcript_19329:147-1247(+)